MNITGYHMHVYCELEQIPLAQSIHDLLMNEKPGIDGAGPVRNYPVGPHALPMFEAWFQPDAINKVLPWILKNRQGLSVLIHPLTGDDYLDHAESAIWIGNPLPINLEMLRT